MKQELTFKSQARIIRTLGDRLISGEVAAIIELVKNAYDADARNCYIEINPEENLLIIRDDGHGMSFSDVQTKWAELGTDNKY
ncbi:MAG: ATP-binding protein, partial [Rhodobacteraceae bacterium]|nr:ATP-binding protein [Paracoccaceae bacterium]